MSDTAIKQLPRATWTKEGKNWCVETKIVLAPGDSVTAVRKDKSTSTVIVGAMVRNYGPGDIKVYEVAS